MGYDIKAYCAGCEFRDKFQLGGNRMNFSRWNPAPGIHKATGEFVVENYYDKTSLTESVVFYNEQGMYEGEEDAWSIQNGDFLLKVERNKCPKCGKFSLRFELIGFVD